MQTQPESSETKNDTSSWGVWLVALIVIGFVYMLLSDSGPGINPGNVAAPIALEQVKTARKWTPSWKQKVTVLEFWATWCSVCKAHLVDSTRRAVRSQRRGIQHLMINVDQHSTNRGLQAFLRRFGIPESQWFVHQRDYKHQGARAFKIRVLPSIVLIDKQGKIAQYFQGTLTDSLLDAYLKQTWRVLPLSKQGMLSLAGAF